jgi:hypothetical protein
MLILVVVLVIIGLIVTATISQFLSKGRKRASVPGGKRYIGLIIVSIITRVLGWTMIVLTGIAVLITFIAQNIALPDLSMAATGLSILMVAVIASGFITTGILLIAIGELILLFIDIERNTRGTEHHSEQSKHAMVALLQTITKPRVPTPQRQP